MHVLKRNVKSICPECYGLIEGKIYEKENKVFMGKKCEKHGLFEDVIETNPEFYKAMINNTVQKSKPVKLMLPITDKCNMDCRFCYYINRNVKDIPIKKLKKLIRDFKGLYISLSGGEPTLRDDIVDLIKYIREFNKMSYLTTNGLMLSDKKYLRKLANAGLDRIHFSLNALDKNILMKMHGKDVLSRKLEALKNIKKQNVETSISFLLEKGVNDQELKKVFIYSLKNSSFIIEVRVRATSPAGRFIQTDSYYMSEMVEILSDILGIRTIDVIGKLNREKENKKTCNVNIDVVGELAGDDFHTFAWDIIDLRRRNRFDMLTNIFTRTPYLKFFYEKLRIITLLLFNKPKKIPYFLLSLIKGRKNIKIMRIGLRCWPNKNSLDMDLIEACPSLILSQEGYVIPFCLGHIYNNHLNKI